MRNLILSTRWKDSLTTPCLTIVILTFKFQHLMGENKIRPIIHLQGEEEKLVSKFSLQLCYRLSFHLSPFACKKWLLLLTCSSTLCQQECDGKAKFTASFYRCCFFCKKIALLFTEVKRISGLHKEEEIPITFTG